MGGYNLKLEVKSKVDVDLDGDGTVDFGAGASSVKEYFVELNKSGYMMGTTLQESENVNYYEVDSGNSSQPDFSKSLGSESTFDGVTTIFAADGSNLGQKSSIDLAEAAKDANSGISKVTDFTGLPIMFKAVGTDTYVRVESHGTAGMPGGSESTYMDASGKVLGVAMTNPSGTSGFRTSYNADLDGQPVYLGESWNDDSGSGHTIYTYGTDTEAGAITGVKASDNGGKNVDYKLLSESKTNYGDTSPYLTREFVFQINDDLTETFLSGVKVEGSSTITYGKDRVVVSEVTNVSALGPKIDLATVRTEFSDGYLAGQGDVFASTTPISPEVTETTYFNSSGVELGSVSTSTSPSGGTADYYNAQGTKVGFVSVNQGTTVASEDAWFETVQTLDGNKVLVRVSESKATELSGATFNETSTFTHEYNVSTGVKGKVLFGERTITDSSGTTKTTYGENEVVTGVYDGTGNIIDPYSLFDLPSWTIPQASLEDYATNVLGDVSLATNPVVKTDYQKMLVDLVLNFQESQPKSKVALR